ncbi:MAG: sulfotransferase [Actinomycetota bacterium]|nr:sulfotransferase [Actinomycetota bacterium]
MDNILGEFDGFFSAGEVRFLWRRLLENRRCGCGQPIGECEIWGPVLRTFLGSNFDHLEARRIVQLQRKSVRTHHTWKLLRRPPGGNFSPPGVAHYAEVTAAVYRTVADLTGARVIVDSSKRPSDGAMLRLLPGIETYFVHLVRDPRAVAYSRQRKKLNPDREIPANMGGKNPTLCAFQWIVGNLGANALQRAHRSDRSMVLRYEDFTRHPRSAIQKITDMLGEWPESTPFLDNRTVQLETHHTVSGNPTRFNTGPTELREDTRWVKGMSARDRRIVTVMTLPQLLHYGYPTRVRPDRPAEAPTEP